MQGCQARIKKQITSPKGLWSLVHQFKMVAVDWSSKSLCSHKAHRSESRADIETLGDYSSSTHEEYKQLATNRWRMMVDLVEQVKDDSSPEAVEALARLAYEVRRSDTFRSLLEILFQQQRYDVSRILDKIGKISKFFRSAVTLTRVAATTPHGFFKVETTPSISREIDALRDLTVADMVRRAPALLGQLASHAAEVQRLIRRWRKYIVHAEMLLLIFYEEHPQISLATNYIGISKRSCYLCANFIRMHGVFAVEGQHQQLYCLWTLPTRIALRSPMQKTRFSRALTDLQRLLRTKVAAVSLPSHRPLTFLKESVANFSRATIIARAESLETLRRVSEAEELKTSHISLPPLVESEEEFQESLNKNGPHSDQVQMFHTEINPSDGFASNSSASRNVNSKRSSDPENPREHHRTHLQPDNQRRRSDARTGGTAGDIRGRRASTTLISQKPRRSGRRKNKRRVRSRKIKGHQSRDLVPVRRSKRASHQRHNECSVGCSTLLVACLKFIRTFVSKAFERH